MGGEKKEISFFSPELINKFLYPPFSKRRLRPSQLCPLLEIIAL